VRERVATLVCAVGALALFLGMFFHKEEGGLGDRDVSRPTTEERGPNGYHAAMEWLAAEHIRTISLRDRFDKLPQKALPAAGNILIVTLPAVAVFKMEEFRPLDRWVRAGNTLVVMAALSDNPGWATSLGGLPTGATPGDLDSLTGLEFESTRLRDVRIGRKSDVRAPVGVRHFSEPKRQVLVPNRDHVYFQDIHAVIALSDYDSLSWTVKVPYEGFVLSLAHQKETGEDALWTRPLGQGRIVISAFGTFFTNRALGLADNARLFSNIVAADLGPRGAVVFDDEHQGLGASYDPVKFYGDPRLHVTVGIIAALWLAWVLGATHLRVPVTRTPAPREAELVRTTGRFMARVLTPAAAARRMFEHFLRRWPWEVLERSSRLGAADLTQLKSWYAQVGLSRVPLLRLHNLMIRIDRQLNS
jgi:Domain of unknown function (DUF4350)